MTQKLAGDVIVIGGGLSGLVTATELMRHGKKVVLVERTSRDRFGGLAKLSFGGVFFVDSPEQRLMGVKDTVDLALHDWITYGELGVADVWPRRWAEAYVSRSLEMIRGYLYSNGVRFFPAVNWTERGYFVPGNSVPRFHIAWGTGEGIVRPFVAGLLDAEKAGRITLAFEHTVVDLIQQNGTYVGVRGTGPSGEDFEARGECVVIAAGGLAGNIDKIRQHWDRATLGEPPAVILNGSIPEADGAMFDLAEKLGVKVTHLEKMWNYAAGVRHWKPRWPDHGLSIVPGKSALWVDYRGERFKDPPLVGSYDTLELVRSVCKREKKHSWQVLNWTILERELAISGAEHNPEVRDKNIFGFLSKLVLGSTDLAKEFLENCPDFVQAGSVRELAAKMNAIEGNQDVDAAVLEDEIRWYDANIDRPAKFQNDDQIRRILHARQYRGDKLRTCNLQKIVDAKAMPLVAIRLSMLSRKSLGGIQTDLSARALGTDGKPVPGLYAVGEASGFGGGGMHGTRALEGTFLGGCTFSGQVAATAIATGRGVDGSA